MGNLTRDPEIRYTQGDKSLAIASFTLAINRRFAKQGENNADFLSCTAFGKTAEFVEKYFKQGSRMILSGRIQNENYTNKNGEKVFSVKIIAEEVEFAERKSSAENNSQQSSQQDKQVDGFMNIPDGIDGTIPFS